MEIWDVFLVVALVGEFIKEKNVRKENRMSVEVILSAKYVTVVIK